MGLRGKRGLSLILLILLFVPLAGAAAEGEIQRALVARDQQAARFALEVRQSQEALRAPAGERGARASRQVLEKGDFDALGEAQLREARREPKISPELRPYQRARMAAERELRFAPPPGIRVEPPEGPRPLPGLPEPLVPQIIAPDPG
jgi:hypothetical protein